MCLGSEALVQNRKALLKSSTFFSTFSKYELLKPFGLFLNAFAIYRNFAERFHYSACFLRLS